MRAKLRVVMALGLILAVAVGATAAAARRRSFTSYELVEVARSERQWTGVAVSETGRVFVTFPRWSAFVPFSVGELLPSGEVRPYPDREWNRWEAGAPSNEHFICAQSVVADGKGGLWVLDPASPSFSGVVSGGAKLVRIDLETNRVGRVYTFERRVAPAASYLNDVRVDLRRGVAYLTDSGLGALVVLDLGSGEARRLLANHFSTKAQPLQLTIGGRPWLLPDGSVPQIHADGLALDADGDNLFWQALTGRTLYRIPTRVLLDRDLAERKVERAVERVSWVPASDGLEFGADGLLYFTALEFDGIRRALPNGLFDTVARDPIDIAWPDSLARGPDGSLWFTTSQIHLGALRTQPYRLFRLVPKP